MDIFMFLQRVNKMSVFVETLKASSSEPKLKILKIRIFFLYDKTGYKEYESILLYTYNTHIILNSIYSILISTFQERKFYFHRLYFLFFQRFKAMISYVKHKT